MADNVNHTYYARSLNLDTNIAVVQGSVLIVHLGASLQHLLLPSIRFCFEMRLLPFYLCALAAILQAISASTLSKDEGASLKNKESGDSRLKPIVGKLVKKGKPQGKCNKELAIKENKLKLLIELLPKELVTIVIGYFDDDAYSFIASTHSWLCKNIDKITVDSARLYVLASAKGIKGLNHALGNIREDERHYIEFGSPQWFEYGWFSSSYDGRYVSFSYSYKTSTAHEEQVEYGTKWFAQSNELEDGIFTCVTLDGEELPYGLLSLDGQTLCSYSYGMNPITRIYRLTEEAGTDPVGLMKYELDGKACAVSGKGNRVVLEREIGLEIHDIGGDISKLVCRIDSTDIMHTCALNEDGSEAAFVSDDGELRLMNVDKVVSAKADQPAIVTVKVPEPFESVIKLVYDDGGKLHMLHREGKVSLFDPLTKEFILLEAPKQEQRFIDWAISPDAGYIAILQESEKDKPFTHKTIVKRKLGSADLKDLFGYENPSRRVKASAVLPEKSNLTQARNALSQSTPAPLTRVTTMPVKRGNLCAFDGNLRHRYVLDNSLEIHWKAIDSGNDRGSVKLPASAIKGDPQYLQTNSDGTVFYLATRMNTKRYIYVIDVAHKRVYEHYLEHLESDIVEIRARLGDKILEVILQDQVVLIFSCENQKLDLINKLIEGERLVGVSQSIAVFEEEESAGLKTVGYFDLTKANAGLCSLPYRNSKFFALDKDDVYLINSNSIIRFNVKTKETAIIKKHHFVRSSHVHDGSIRVVDHDFVYRVFDIKTLCQLYAIRLPSLKRQKYTKLHTSISSDGRRVMVSQPGVAHLFEIVDPKFLHKMQAIEKRTKAKPVKLSKASTQRKSGLPSRSTKSDANFSKPTEYH